MWGVGKTAFPSGGCSCHAEPLEVSVCPGRVEPALLSEATPFPRPPQAQLIAQSIGQAFSVAYQEFLRANGINPEDLSQKEYSDVINTQEMYNDDLIHFSNSENCKEVSGAPGSAPLASALQAELPRASPSSAHGYRTREPAFMGPWHRPLSLSRRKRCLNKYPAPCCAGSRALVCEMSWWCNREADYSRS